MATPDMDLSHAAWHKSSYSNNGGACVEVATNLPGSRGRTRLEESVRTLARVQCRQLASLHPCAEGLIS